MCVIFSVPLLCGTEKITQLDQDREGQGLCQGDVRSEKKKGQAVDLMRSSGEQFCPFTKEFHVKV